VKSGINLPGRPGRLEACLLISVVAMAMPPQGIAEEADGGIQEVVVTAQKRAENSQSVPISIQTFDESRMRDLGIRKLQDIESAAPSLSFGDGSEQGRNGIRGIIDYSRNAGYDGRVGIYVDGVYYSRSWMMNQTLLGTQQIDVLRGPQGTLFGKNTDAGAISITTLQPQLTGSSGELEGEYGSFNHWKAAGRINIPLGERIALQVSATHLEDDGYYHNDTLGKRNQGADSNAIRAQLLLVPRPGLRLTLAGDFAEDDNSTVHYTAVPAAGADPHHFKSYNDDYAKRRMYGGSLTADFELPGGYSLTSISAWRSGWQILDFNNEASAVPFITAYLNPLTNQFSQEIRIASPRSAHWDYVAGLYYFSSTNRDYEETRFGPAMGLLGQPYARYANVNDILHASVDTSSIAAFANGNLRLNDTVELFAGARVTEERKHLDYINNVDPIGIIFTTVSGLADHLSDTSFTPKGGINLHLKENLLLFASFGRGYKSGGWNVEGVTAAQIAAGLEFRPESVDSYELGLKSEFLNRHARLNLTGFYQKYTDFQVFSFVTAQVAGRTVSTQSLTNAAKASAKGVELELMLIPVDGLTLAANYTYDDSKYDSFPGGGDTYNGARLDADGVQMPYAPKNKAYFSADYATALGHSGLQLRAHFGYSTQSSQNFDPKVVNPLYTAGYYIAGYDLADMRLSLLSDAQHWTVSLWSKNLFDKEYVRFANRTALLGNNAVLYGSPRTVGATLEYRY